MNRTGEALCAALRDGPASESQVDLAALSPAEWNDVAALAIRQRVGPLLYSRSGLPMPDDVRARLRARAEMSVRRVLMQQAAFREFAAAVAPLGISLIALKGIHLATSVYPSAALREMGDIDVLVAPDRLRAVSDVARSIGYATPPITAASHHHLPPLVKGRVALEIHWQLTEGALGVRAGVDALLKRAVDLNGMPGAKALNTEDLLLHTCIHAANHHVLEMGIRSLCDLQAIVADGGHHINWPTAVERSREWGCERGFALVLTLAQKHLGVRIPESVVADLGNAVPSANLVDSATDFLIEDAVHLAGTSEASRTLLTLPNTRERIRHISGQVLLPVAQPVGQQAYPSQGALPTAIKRAYGLVRRHGRWLWRASRNRSGPLHAALRKRNALADWIRNR